MSRPESDDAAAAELLLALAAARAADEPTTYEQVLAEATTEPARSVVLIDALVRLLLGVAAARSTQQPMSKQDFVRVLMFASRRLGGPAGQRGRAGPATP